MLLYPLIQQGTFRWLMPAQPAQPAPVVAPAAVTPLTILIAALVTVACLALAAYALYKLPSQIGKAGARATHSAAQVIVPAVTHHKPISKKTWRRLSYQVTTALKLVAIILPLATCIIVPEFSALQKDVVVITTIFFAAWAVFDFALQFIITRLQQLDTTKVW